SPTRGAYGMDTDARYPDFLARRLAERRDGPRLSVLNLGISGNRVLVAGTGPSLLVRLGPDVLARPDVTDVILLEGINDLGRGASAPEVVAGLRQAVGLLRAARRSRELHVLVGTLTPAGGAAEGPAYARTEAARRAVNRAIREGGLGDGVVDFDRAVRDTAHPDRLAPRFDSGDHLHPSAAGYRRMAAAVPLARLGGTGC
ncbi:MAG TPA: GDSL-type esterase/lipase family protein, partial [Solirubrobacteraceae bacterium]